jgi:hypothetical protein
LATPRSSISRSSVTRLAEGIAEPAFFMPLPSSGLGGADVSATSTSPLGST